MSHDIVNDLERTKELSDEPLVMRVLIWKSPAINVGYSHSITHWH